MSDTVSLIGRHFIFRSQIHTCGDLDMIFTCVGSVITGDKDAITKLWKLFCRTDRQKLSGHPGEKLYVIKSDTGKIRLMQTHQFEEKTLDVTEKIDDVVFNRYHPGIVMLFPSTKNMKENLIVNAIGSRISDKIKIVTVSHRCLDKNLRLHVRVQ